MEMDIYIEDSSGNLIKFLDLSQEEQDNIITGIIKAGF